MMHHGIILHPGEWNFYNELYWNNIFVAMF